MSATIRARAATMLWMSSLVACGAADGGAELRRPLEAPVGGGFLIHASALVDPWCGATLVTASVAVTSVSCVRDPAAWELTFGISPDAASPRSAVTRVDRRGELAYLILDPPMRPGPAARASPPLVRGGVMAEVLDFEHAPRGQTFRVEHRVAWIDAADSLHADITVDGPFTSCHGVGGSPLFVDGSPVGVVVRARTAEGGGCTDGQTHALIRRSPVFRTGL